MHHPLSFENYYIPEQPRMFFLPKLINTKEDLKEWAEQQSKVFDTILNDLENLLHSKEAAEAILQDFFEVVAQIKLGLSLRPSLALLLAHDHPLTLSIFYFNCRVKNKEVFYGARRVFARFSGNRSSASNHSQCLFIKKSQSSRN